MILPSLREAVPGERYTIAYPDEEEPFLALWWDGMLGAWQVLDRDGVPFRGEARRVMLGYIARSFSSGLPPRVLHALERGLTNDHERLLTTRHQLEATS